VKELGASVYDCPCLAEDVSKIFEVYWALGEENATVPTQWPEDLATDFNHVNPMAVLLNGTSSSAYLAVRTNFT
jgi:phospholipase D3/4